ncbi:MAG: phosphoribosylamine--glycine ligase [Bacteroidetes bacterium]|nr:MAG: phosphoribosylamine--glycine ligase [Bacteroidota bacterium]
MKILVVGGGGREHAIVQSLAETVNEHQITTAPGNAGTAAFGMNVSIAADDVDALCRYATREAIDMVIVGPEIPLVLGLADRLKEKNVSVVGPTMLAARLEGSKAFAKFFMEKNGIPTASYQLFHRSNVDEALAYIRTHGAPVVVKASGLAAGKGAIVCMSEENALEAVSAILHDNSMGDAGEEIVIESFMEGEEASVFAVTDGTDYVILPTAQDHKRVGDGDTGPNTGGMGAYAPAPVMTEELLDEVCRTVVEPTLEGMRKEGSPYSGILYCGLMITAEGPKVVEFNCRLGDPESQVVLPLIKSDIAELFRSVADGCLSDYELEISNESAACVVLASEGYPRTYEKGKTISGIGATAGREKTFVYQAGVAVNDAGDSVTSGGRVLAVTGLGSDLLEAVDRAYEGVRTIAFEGQFYRRDIGEKGLARTTLL